MNREIDVNVGLPLAVRQKKLRRTRRSRALLELGQNTVWMVVLVGIGVFVAAELIGAIGRV